MSRSSRRLDVFEQAEIKGRDAYLHGKSERDCPYEDKRTTRGCVTFSRGFVNAWLRGFREARRQIEESET
jgi:ribosome modulation factor